MNITTRQASVNDLEQILQLFEETIDSINAKDYSPEQIAVWKNGTSKKERWLKKISEQYFLLAQTDNEIIGFGSITHDGYLDFMYVSKNHQRSGIAQEIYVELEAFAKAKHLSEISSDVSITAKPFFEKQGFKVVREQEVNIAGVKLINYKMNKQLN